MKSATKQHVAWLSAEQAAVHLGFVDLDGKPRMGAFRTWCWRAKPRKHWIGGLLRFRVVDLDRMVESEPEPIVTSLTMLQGGKR